MDPRLPLQERVALAPFSTLEVGGPARYYVRAGDADTVAGAVRWAADIRGRCAARTSVSWLCTVCTGLSAFIDPWKTMDSSCQRNARS